MDFSQQLVEAGVMFAGIVFQELPERGEDEVIGLGRAGIIGGGSVVCGLRRGKQERGGFDKLLEVRFVVIPERLLEDAGPGCAAGERTEDGWKLRDDAGQRESLPVGAAAEQLLEGGAAAALKFGRAADGGKQEPEYPGEFAFERVWEGGGVGGVVVIR